MSHRPLALSIPFALLSASPASAQCSLDQWLASDGLEGDRFGTDVALRGDLALVGAADRDEGAPGSGAADPELFGLALLFFFGSTKSASKISSASGLLAGSCCCGIFSVK